MVQTKVESITAQLRAIQIKSCSPYSDGYSASGYKKELVMIRHAINTLIKKCPDFGDIEDDWEKEIMFNVLKDDT